MSEYPRKRDLTVCLMFRNTAEYLEEWLLFHLAVGFDHFYFYNNDSTDDWRPVAQPFIDGGLITVVDYPGDGKQEEAYQHCLDTFREEARWICFFDDDEFLFPSRPALAGEPGCLREILAGYEEHAGVAVNWMLYGTNGQEKKEPGYVIERFTRRHKNPDQHPKILAHTPHISHCVMVGHEFAGKDGFVVVDEKKRPVEGHLFKNPSADTLRLNHYLTKSREELIDRRSRVMVNTGRVSDIPMEQWFEFDKGWNDVEDDAALFYMPRMEELRRRWLGR